MGKNRRPYLRDWTRPNFCAINNGLLIFALFPLINIGKSAGLVFGLSFICLVATPRTRVTNLLIQEDRITAFVVVILSDVHGTA